MIAYQKIGENAILNNSPRNDAAHNGGSDWGIHKMTHSYPFGFDNIFEGISGGNDFKTVLGDDFSEQESIMTNRIVKGDIPKSGRNENPVNWNGGDGRLLVTNRIQKENELVAKDIDIAGYVIGEKPDAVKIKNANSGLSQTEILELVRQANEHFKLYSK